MDRLMRFAVMAALVVAFPGLANAQTATKTRVQVVSEPAGAAVYVDGAVERAGETPVTLNLSRGEHRVRLVLEGFATEEQTVTVGSSRQTLSFRLHPVATVEVTAANTDAEGATVNVDGQPVGTIPLTQILEPGRHQIEITREGFQPYSRWLEVSAGQNYALSVALQASAPRRGTILVGGAISGAPVTVDGQSQGVTPAVVEVEAGQHTVVVSPEGQTPHSETVTVTAGQRVTVNPTFAPAPGRAGSLRVLTQPANAEISVDGEARGASPATIEDLAPGSHIVEATLEGHRAASTRVTIEPGRRETVQLTLERVSIVGRLRVTSDVAGAQVLLDGRPLGTAPVTEDGVPVGSHQVVVRAPGHADWQQQIQITGGTEVTVNATPQSVAQNGFISVSADAPGAEVFIDGQLLGNSPLVNHEIAAGQHTVEVRAEGFRSFTTTVNVIAGGTQQINAALVAGQGGREGEGDGGRGGRRGSTSRGGEGDDQGGGEAGEGEEGESEEDEAARREEEENRTRFVNAASALRQWKLGIDGSWGWPYFVGWYRLTLGVYDNLDVAVEARSFYRFTEIDVRARYGARLARVIGLGAELSIGGGWGEFHRNAFVFGISAYEALEFTRWSLALRERMLVHSDRWSAQNPHRDGGVMFYLGVALEIRLSEHLHLFAILDYAPGQGNRLVNCWRNVPYVANATCGSRFPGDVAIEGRLGLGARFF